MTAQPGWYPDPSGRPGQTYWDGQRWHAPPAASGPAQVAARQPVPPSRVSPAGWYPDPAGTGRTRYFSGTEWTEHYSGPPAQQQGFATQRPNAGGGRQFQIKLSKHTGAAIVFVRQSYVVTGTFEDCEKAYRQAQLHNLTLGWWSLFSVLLFNWISIFSNVAAMSQLRKAAQQ